MTYSQYPYPLAQQTWGEDEKAALRRVVESDFYTMGPEVRAFEKAFAKWVGAQFALMTNSGSSANLLCFEALMRPAKGQPQLQRGDEVIVPALAWGTTLSPVIQMGLHPKIVDIDPESLALAPQAIKAAITEKTKAIFLIHVLGRPADIQAIQKICDEHHLILIEDCCESLGALYQGTHVGNFGQMGTFSFYFSHHISTMEGGMIILNDEALYNEIISMRAHGWSRHRLDEKDFLAQNPHLDSRFVFLTTGYNLRPTEFQGALGNVQLGRLDDLIKGRRELAFRVKDYVAQNLSWLRLIGADVLGREDGVFHSFMCLPFVLNNDAPISKAGFCQHLEAHGVETRPIIAGNILKHPAARYLPEDSQTECHTADEVLDQGFMIGCHPYLKEESWTAFTHAIQAAKDLD